MGDVNLDRLRTLAGHLRDAVRQLREAGRIPIETFVADVRSVNRRSPTVTPKKPAPSSAPSASV